MGLYCTQVLSTLSCTEEGLLHAYYVHSDSPEQFQCLPENAQYIGTTKDFPRQGLSTPWKVLGTTKYGLGQKLSVDQWLVKSKKADYITKTPDSCVSVIQPPSCMERRVTFTTRWQPCLRSRTRLIRRNLRCQTFASTAEASSDRNPFETSGPQAVCPETRIEYHP